MKGVVVGDFLLPTSILEKVYQGDDVEKRVESYTKTDFICETRADIRNVWRQFELHGPSGVAAPDDLPGLVADAEVIAVHICPVNKAIIDAAKNLKIILSARGGLENIDVQEATARGIPVFHTPNHNAQAVAEYTVGLILSETRNIARSHCALKQGVWQEYYPNSAFIPELNELKIGVVGYGANGRLVAEKLRSFNTEILICDPFVPDDVVKADGYRPVSKDELLKEADVITLHVRLTPKTQKMFGAEEFKQMKDSAYFINTARSGLVDTDAMVQALRDKSIMGAAIDVFDVEPLPKDSPLITIDNLTLTNHRAGDTRNSYWNAPNLMRREMLTYLNGGTPRFVANRQVL
ncbi:MAG: 2-hydroxyacid dehydrogenase [Planctomycetaceae bacterium]|nr:2-hydroxyacid dehydrogenase [Planctomycetaceae bacterium]